MSKSFLEILNSSWQELNRFELFIQTFFSSLILTIIFSFISLVISSGDNFWIVFSSFEIFILFYRIFILLRSFLEEHFNMYDENDTKSNSYEGWIIGLCILSLGIFLCFLGIGYAFDVLLTGFSLGLIFVFPPYFMLFRRDTYNESKNLSEDDDIGFQPKIYWVLSIFCGFVTVVPSFRFLEAYFLWNFPNLFVCLSLIIVSFLWIIMVLSPDIWNNYLPFNIKSSNGILKYIIIVMIVSIILSISFGLVI